MIILCTCINKNDKDLIYNKTILQTISNIAILRLCHSIIYPSNQLNTKFKGT